MAPLLPKGLPSAAFAIGLALAMGLVSASPAPAAAQAPAGHGAISSKDFPPSTAAQKSLSEQLKAKGALFYGAWWCPACHQQKELFGKEAAAGLPYVECDKTAEGRKACSAAEITAYPTWILKGKPNLVGVQSLEELKAWLETP
ncbi:hypothetical protein [Cyanobium sp. WAJ14-Wanaka]|uniref:hypothetical protein n=1 Tax=Cyanobium sp. WAJ14-Wanaka TaxID=2823725 RepID=UPI0020CFCC5A|nr:hypothetical protein [Cyanobium sp. WAJ14-Wanaka]MCP9776110.1 hypothetical protein [Cyanobium sp. WAJ14-Wanaka]